MKKALLTIIGMLMLTSNIALAAIPNAINYQGRLTDTGGNPYADGTYSMTINLYNQPTGGSSLGTEVHNISTKNGYFSVEIGGASSPINLSLLGFNETYYIGISINPDTEMTPRKKITSVGYAFRAEKATLADNATTATTATSATNATNAVVAANSYQLGGIDAANFITKNTGSVTSADVAAGAVDTQAKAPWAAGVSSDGTLLANPIIACGTGVTDVNGELSVSLSSFGFAARPWVVCTPILIVGVDPVLITIDNSSDKDHFFARSWYQPNDDRFQQKGPIFFWWIAVGAK